MSSSSNEEGRYFKNILDKATDPEVLVKPDGTLTKLFKTRLRSTIDKLIPAFEAEVLAPNHKIKTSIYTGRGGYAYLYLHLALLNFDGQRDELLKKAQMQVNHCLRDSPNGRISFLCGDVGVLALAVVIKYYQEGFVDQKLIQRVLGYVKAADNLEHPDEILYGRAGLLYTLLFVRKHCGSAAIKDDAVNAVIKDMIQNGRDYSKKHKSRVPLMYSWHGKEYIGAAHGVSGILFMLLQAKEFLSSEDLNNLILPTLQKMSQWRYPSGNFKSREDSTDDRLVQWCHGSPGVIHLYAKASEVFDNPYKKDFLSVAVSCSEDIWRRGLLRKGYGLCHGTSGNAYSYIALYNATKDIKYVQKAALMANWICDFGSHGCSTPDEPFSLMNGMAGTILFLADFLYNENDKRRFPAFHL